MNSCILSGLRWLNSSGIQDESGGVSRYYRHQTASSQPVAHQPISTAVTGYFIRSLLWANRFSGDEPSERARLAGRFLLEHSFDLSREVFPFEHPMGARPPASLAYFFDCGMTIRALLQLAKATEDPSYLECAERCGLVMSTRMATVDGGFFALFDIDADRPFTDSGSWSVQAEVHQLKVGLAFLELFEATGRGEFEHATQGLRKWCLRRHESFLSTDEPAPDKIVSQVYAYACFLEGLLPVAALEQDSARALQFGILQIENLLGEYSEEYQRCDVIAQLLRLRLYADNYGVMELDYNSAAEEAAVVEAFQVQSPDPKIDGGFAFARRNGEIILDINPTATIFAIQALSMWDEGQQGAFRDPWETLI